MAILTAGELTFTAYEPKPDYRPTRSWGDFFPGAKKRRRQRGLRERRLLWTDKTGNMTVNVALDDVLDVQLSGGTQKTTWYLGLVNNAGFTALAAGDTMSSTPGWDEYTSYDESTRRTWVDGGVASQTVSNVASPATFTFNETAAMKGGFLVSNNTKGGTTGLLWATGAFGSVQNMANLQTLDVTYTATAAAA